MSDKLTVSVPEAAKALGIGRNLAYTMAAEGQLPVIRCGAKRLVVPVVALNKLLRAEANKKGDEETDRADTREPPE